MPYKLITSPESLFELFTQAPERGVSSADVQSVTELAAQDEQSYPRDREGLVYHIESLEAVKAGLDNDVSDMVTYWWGRYRDAMADTLKIEGHHVIQPEEADFPSHGENQYFPIRGSSQGYKLEKSKPTTDQSGSLSHVFQLSVPRDFSGVHPNLMPERIDHIDRPVGVTNITFAPFLKNRRSFFDVMSTLLIRERAIHLLNICLSVYALHKSRYAHMDLKSDNVVFGLQHGELKAYVVDLESVWPQGENSILQTSLCYSPLGYYKDWQENIRYIIQLDAFSLAHVILEGLCGKVIHESLAFGMIDNRTYDIKDPDDVFVFLDQFFSHVVDEKGGAIPDQLKIILKNLLRWRKNHIPSVKDLCDALSHGYAIDVQ